MGLIQSVFCSITFCLERVLTWTCCAFMLILMLSFLIIMMIYSISTGYHYAQKELAAFAMSSRASSPAPSRRSGDTRRSGGDHSGPIVRLVAINRTRVEQMPPHIDLYQTRQPSEEIYLETSETPIVLLETERPPAEPELSPHEKELARRLIGRFRRSRNMSSPAPFLRPLKNNSDLKTVLAHS